MYDNNGYRMEKGSGLSAPLPFFEEMSVDEFPKAAGTTFRV